MDTEAEVKPSHTILTSGGLLAEIVAPIIRLHSLPYGMVYGGIPGAVHVWGERGRGEREEREGRTEQSQ